MRGASSVLAMVILALQLVGCATQPAPSRTPEQYDSINHPIRRVALVADLTLPSVEKVDLGHTRGEGAARGAAAGALETLSQVGPAGIILLPVVMSAYALAGSASGHSAEELAQAESDAQRVLSSGQLQSLLLAAIANYAGHNTDLEFARESRIDRRPSSGAPNYAALSAAGFDLALEVGLRRIALQRSLEIDARARLISAQSGTVLSDQTYRFTSGERDLASWLGNGGKALPATLQLGLQRLASDIVDEHFLLFYPPKPDHASQPGSIQSSNQVEIEAKPKVPYYVLSPVSPEVSPCVICGEYPFSKRPRTPYLRYEFVEVHDASPEFRWQSFPRDYDAAGPPEQSHEISDVTYELKVFKSLVASHMGASLLIPGEQVYEARGMPEPSHKLLRPLDPCGEYFWTIRAKFRLNGKLRVTEWSGLYLTPPWTHRRTLGDTWLGGKWWSLPPPEWFYLPFKVPCTPKSTDVRDASNNLEGHD